MRAGCACTTGITLCTLQILKCKGKGSGRFRAAQSNRYGGCAGICIHRCTCTSDRGVCTIRTICTSCTCVTLIAFLALFTLDTLLPCFTLGSIGTSGAGIALVTFITLIAFEVCGRSTGSRSDRQGSTVPAMGYRYTILTCCAGCSSITFSSVLTSRALNTLFSLGALFSPFTLFSLDTLCACCTRVSLVSFVTLRALGASITFIAFVSLFSLGASFTIEVIHIFHRGVAVLSVSTIRTRLAGYSLFSWITLFTGFSLFARATFTAISDGKGGGFPIVQGKGYNISSTIFGGCFSLLNAGNTNAVLNLNGCTKVNIQLFVCLFKNNIQNHLQHLPV